MLHVGEQQAEEGRAEQEAGDQLAHHRRLAQPRHGLAQQATYKHEDDELGDKNRVRRTLSATLGGPGGADRKRGQDA
jgi:hypothetical protein